MTTIRASAVWEGKLRDGNCSLRAGGGGGQERVSRVERAQGQRTVQAGREAGLTRVGLARRDVIGLVLALGAVAVCVRLGVWQLARLHQRRAANALVRAARERPPVELSGRAAADSLWNRRVRARGVYDFDHERLWRPRMLADEPGVGLVAPLRPRAGSGVLLDPGWAPSPDGYHIADPLYREPDTADVTGLALAAPRGRGDVDPATLKDSMPYPLLPFVIQLLPSPTAPDRPF